MAVPFKIIRNERHRSAVLSFQRNRQLLRMKQRSIAALPDFICSELGSYSECVNERFVEDDLIGILQNQIAPIHIGSKWGRDKMVQLLLDNGADINSRTKVREDHQTCFVCLNIHC